MSETKKMMNKENDSCSASEPSKVADIEEKSANAECECAIKEDESEEKKLPVLTLPEPTSGYVKDISVFCITQQGESHIKNDIPCQDRSEFRWVKDQILITAIADGVGSCSLSDYGAEIAVKSSLNYLEKYFLTAIEQQDFCFDVPKQMKAVLSNAMQYAYDLVEKYAKERELLSYSMQSTLTITIYDGTTLYFAHAGDDGVVALNKEGIYEMVTERIKGEDVSSVFTLQSKQWFYGKVDDVVAFVMATDGVLDAFVRPVSEKNRVYYRFVEPVFYTSQTDEESAKLNCQDWESYLKSPEYRKKVADDITFVGIVNQKAIKKSRKPVFDDEKWKMQSEEYTKKRKSILYPSQNKKRTEGKKQWENLKKTEKSEMNDPLQRRSEYEDNIDLINNGTRQILSGLSDLSAAYTATAIQVVGDAMFSFGELSKKAAEKIKQKQIQGKQQKTEKNMNPENMSTDRKE